MDYLIEITERLKVESQSQYIAKRISYYQGKGLDTGTISRQAIETFERQWSDLNSRMEVVPGKTTLRLLRGAIQDDYKINLSDVQIIDEFTNEDIPVDLLQLIEQLEAFRVD